MSYESATYVNELDKNLPRGSDSISEGDIHLRTIKDVLKQSFPNVDSAVNVIHTGATAPVLHSAGTVWFDTASGLIKMRDTTDSHWLNMAHGEAGGIGSTLKMEWHDLGNWSGRLSDQYTTIWNFDFTPLSPTSNIIIDVSGSAQCAGYGQAQELYIRLLDATNDIDLTGGYIAAGFRHVDDAGNFEVLTGFSMRKNMSSHPPGTFNIAIQGLATNSETESGQGLELVQASVLEVE